MKHHLILSSRFTTGKNVEHGREIIRAINLNLNEVSMSEAKRPGHAEQLSREALRSGAESILVAAGDAMINEVVNGFFEDGKPVSEKPHLGVIPTKAGGDFCRTAGVPEHLLEAVGRIGQNQPRPIDLGRIVTANGKSRYFANVCTTGVSAVIGRENRSVQWLNEIEGDLAFNWSVIKNSLLHNRFPLHLSIPGGPQTLRWDANCVAICNGHSFGGGITLARDADMSDGFLDVIVVHDFSKIGFLKGVNQVRRGGLVEMDGISTIRTSKVLLSCDDPERSIMVDADSEFAGYLPARFDVVPSAAMLF